MQAVDMGFTAIPNYLLNGAMKDCANRTFNHVLTVIISKCYGDKKAMWYSHAALAKAAGVSVSTIKRALKYWSDKGILKIYSRFLRDINKPSDWKTERDVEYYIPTSNLVCLTFDKPKKVSRPSKDMSQAEQGGGSTQNYPGGFKAELQNNPTMVEEHKEKKDIQDEDKSSPSIDIAPSYDVIGASQSFEPNDSHVEASDNLPDSPEALKTALSMYCTLTRKKKLEVGRSERRHLERLVLKYGKVDVVAALSEISIQMESRAIDSPLRYCEGILKCWASEGKRTTVCSKDKPNERRFKPTGDPWYDSNRRPEDMSYYAKYIEMERAMLDSMPVDDLTA